MEKEICLWDGHNTDFLENFKTLEEAEKYCFNLIEKQPNYFHSYVIGKWISLDSDDYIKLETIFYDKWGKETKIEKFN
jgi:hypothetical protein